MGFIERTKQEYKEGGIIYVLLEKIRKHIHFLAEKIRKNGPHSVGEFNGIKVPDRPILNPLSGRKINKPSYKEEAVDSIERKVEIGDRITVLGGGVGVTAVKAAKVNREPGKVTVYEGAEEKVEKTEETLELNNCTEVEIKHAVVGTPENVWGDYSDAKLIEHSRLEPCDVLEMDIEGAEIEILEKMEIQP